MAIKAWKLLRRNRIALYWVLANTSAIRDHLAVLRSDPEVGCGLGFFARVRLQRDEPKEVERESEREREKRCALETGDKGTLPATSITDGN